MSNKPTLAQVAVLARVSPSAASMILSARANVSFLPETVERVHRAAAELGYLSKTSKNIPCSLIHKTIFLMAPSVVNPYYAALLQSIEQSARSRGYTTIIYNTYRDAANERQIVTMVEALRPAGVIFAMPPTDQPLVEQLSHRVPTIVIGDRDSTLSIDAVETSNYHAGELMAEHLVSLGHRHIAFLSTTLDRTNTARTKRLDGTRDAMRRICPDGSVTVLSRDITPSEELGNLLLEHTVGYELCHELLTSPSSSHVTALVGVNDMVAYGVIDAAISLGYSVPNSHSVAGFDNNFPSLLSTVSLTSVEHCITDKGHVAFDMLYDKMMHTTGSSEPNRITRVEYRQHLIARGSTAPPRAR